jgi:hypothetical protein
MVHVQPLVELDPVVLYRSPLELLERVLHVYAVVSLPFVCADRYPIPFGVDAVLHTREIVIQLAGLGRKRGEPIGRSVVPEVIAKRPEASRCCVQK